MRRTLVAVAAAVGLASCVAPARSFGAYEGKAVATADTALSAVRTAQLAARLGIEGKAFTPYVATTIANAETDIRSAQGLFDSIQPPDPEAESLRTRLDAILSQADEQITTLRVRARWTDIGALGSVADRLSGLGDRLDAFVNEHQ